MNDSAQCLAREPGRRVRAGLLGTVDSKDTVKVDEAATLNLGDLEVVQLRNRAEL